MTKAWGLRLLPWALVLVAAMSAWFQVRMAVTRAEKAETTLKSEREAAAAVAVAASLAASAAEERAENRLASELKTEKEKHERIERDLRAELARSRLASVSVPAGVARLHDAAAGGDAAPAASAPEPGTAAGEADPADESGFTAADLTLTCTRNYEIAARNAARLVELQAWYEDLRARVAGNHP